MGPAAARRPADRRPAALPARPSAPCLATVALTEKSATQEGGPTAPHLRPTHTSGGRRSNLLLTSRRRAQAPWPHSALRQSLPAGKDCRQSARRQTREHSHARLHRSSPPRRRPHSSGRRAAGSGGPMRRRSARQLLSSAGSCRRTALSRSDQATPPPECCRHAVVHARVWCADRLGAGALSERLRRPAVAQSELCRAVGPGEAGARSPLGSRNTGQGGHRRPKKCSETEWARGVFAVWQ